MISISGLSIVLVVISNELVDIFFVLANSCFLVTFSGTWNSGKADWSLSIGKLRCGGTDCAVWRKGYKSECKIKL